MNADAPIEPVVAIDYETYYESQTYSLKLTGTHNYVRDPKFDAYLVAIYLGPGHPLNFVGRPEHYEHWLDLPRRRWIAHNASFDERVTERLYELGKIPAEARPEQWDCTADMAAGLGYGRSLANAVNGVWGVKLDKGPRTMMSGKRWEDLPEDKQEVVLKYAHVDAEACWKLWTALSDQWPVEERTLSRLTRTMCYEGVGVDTAKLVDGIRELSRISHEAATQLPWYDAATGEDKLLSKDKIAKWCRSVGLPPPPSMAKTDEDAELWLAEHGKTHPELRQVATYRSSKILLQKYRAVRARIDAETGGLPYGLKYCGAHTGRWSGDDGMNMQNLPQGEMFGCTLRDVFVPRRAKRFYIADYSAIEPTCMALMTGDQEKLVRLAAGENVYQIHAERTMGHPRGVPLEKKDTVYRLAKCRELALGYGVGKVRFRRMAWDWAKVALTEDESEQQVNDYRAKHPHILGLWNRLGDAFVRKAMARLQTQDDTFRLDLPSGRSLWYWRIQPCPPDWGRRGWAAEIGKGSGQLRSIYGGKLCENLIQAVARDVMAAAILRLHYHGIKVALHVHDEVVVECDSEDQAAEIEALMKLPPEWAPSIPLSVKGHFAERYC